MRSELQLDVCCRSCCGGDIWWTHTKERQAWCCLQVKLCDPHLSALSVVATIKALYKYTSFLSFPYQDSNDIEVTYHWQQSHRVWQPETDSCCTYDTLRSPVSSPRDTQHNIIASPAINNKVYTNDYCLLLLLLLLLHPFNNLFSRTNWISRHQKGKPFWILLHLAPAR